MSLYFKLYSSKSGSSCTYTKFNSLHLLGGHVHKSTSSILFENSLWLEYVYSVEPRYISNLWNAGHLAQVRIVFPSTVVHYNHWNADISLFRNPVSLTQTGQPMIRSLDDADAAGVLNVTSRVLYFTKKLYGVPYGRPYGIRIRGVHCSIDNMP